MEKLLILGLVGLFAWNAFAGLEDFNSIIQENQKVQKDLQVQLQKDAGIDVDASKAGSIAKEERFVPSESEQIVVTTSSDLLKPREREVQLDETGQIERLSQEMRELNQ